MTSFRESIFRVEAPDGSLIFPESVPAIDFSGLQDATFTERARRALGAWLDAEIGDLTSTLCREAFDFPVPLARLDADTWLLELFHGPSGAFKDFGARFLARALLHLRPPGQRLTVLAATSGDTGAAVAQAFGGLAATRVVLLYPAGRVSPLQEALLTAAAENVHPLRVAGSFDACQSMVRAAFRDADLVHEMGLVSTNSLNFGRLLPQITYYAHASLEVGIQSAVGQAHGESEPGSGGELVVVVPSGNLGNLTAGLLAKRGGAPIRRFLCATNRNDVFPRYLASGVFRPQTAVPTLSNAMDVGNPSNAGRIQALYGDRVEDLRRDVIGVVVDDAETIRVIRETYEDSGRLVCPHTAVGIAARRRHADLRPAVVLATAHPGKFAEVMYEATGQHAELPEHLQDHLTALGSPIDITADPDEFRRFLRNLASN